MNLKDKLTLPIFETIQQASANLGVKSYVIGGWVRDLFLKRQSNDIDILCIGSGIDLAREVSRLMGIKNEVSYFKNFGTAMVHYYENNERKEIEFVGARKESYSHDSRKPIVENGTLEDDLQRRDFTINALALSLSKEDFGEFIDIFEGLNDLDNGIIRTPLDADITFSDDPLRMMRAIRFASQLNFVIYNPTFEAIQRNAYRIEIVSAERIIEELNKIMLSPRPSIGIKLMDRASLLNIILPELVALKGVDVIEGKGHKDNFKHTLEVLDNICQNTDKLYLRWAALLHDIGKAQTKRFDPKLGFTFHSHEIKGAKMVKTIFRRLKLPLNENMHYVEKLVSLHLRPIALVEDIVTDSAVRRLLFDASEDIDDLMMLCNADITSKNYDKVKKFRNNFAIVKSKLIEIEQKDKVRCFQPPVSGEDIMKAFALSPCQEIGVIKAKIKDSILDGVIPNEREAAIKLMYSEAQKLGLKKQVEIE